MDLRGLQIDETKVGNNHLQGGQVWLLVDDGEQSIVGVLSAAQLDIAPYMRACSTRVRTHTSSHVTAWVHVHVHAHAHMCVTACAFLHACAYVRGASTVHHHERRQWSACVIVETGTKGSPQG